ncbi:MAG: metabolite traffic protein EboE [Chitinophagaceae bacterium]|nr:metabolite traffic protein EboE [Chitinophagaceae bacterium]
MQTRYGHLTYCTNIHAGEGWDDHFTQLREHIPAVKKQVAPNQAFGIGLRLSNQASIELAKPENLARFKHWLKEHNCYVFTMNGFPYGGFHRTVVKDKVHAPDWTTPEREAYTIRLAHLLADLLPGGMDGGISTSPLTYCFWHEAQQLPGVFEKSTLHLLQVVDRLIQIKQATGKIIHIDIEPEPDGLLGDGKAFTDWYTQYLLPLGIPFISKQFGCDEAAAALHIRQHVQLCYDICHFAVCYEDHAGTIRRLQELGIKTGKIQISAALKAELPDNKEKREATMQTFSRFNESVYLHQVVALQQNGQLKRYPDMPAALQDAGDIAVKEWRAHFHVPVFEEEYGLLQSTQQDIKKLLDIHLQQPFTSHLEVETYTWEVLPEEKKLPLTESITREIQWVKGLLGEEK